MTSYRANTRSGTIRYALCREVLGRNSRISGIVRCLLAIANQLDVLLAQPFSLRLGAKILLNFLIPFAVSSTSAVLNRQRGHR
jgi:hypothetical protein